jgi:hypothetical protein
MRVAQKSINTMIQTGITHNLNMKEEFHRTAKAYLKDLAIQYMGLGTNQFEVRSNKGGPGVLGEVILHTDNLYVCMGGSVAWGDGSFYYRTCKGRKDYTGGRNVFMKYKDLEDYSTTAKTFKEHR